MIKYASLSKWPRYLRSFCGVNKRCWRIDFNIERSRLSESDSAACSCLLLLLLLLPRDDELRVVNLVDVFSCKFQVSHFSIAWAYAINLLWTVYARECVLVTW